MMMESIMTNEDQVLLEELHMKTMKSDPSTAFDKNIFTRDHSQDDNTNIKLDQVLLKLDAVIRENDDLRNAVMRENEWRRQQVNVLLFMLLAAAVHYLFPN